jgi:protein SCO1/2
MFQFRMNRAAALIAVASVLLAAAQAPAANPLDVDVVDQDGHAVRFYSDLMKDRVVAINFIFTSCQTICTLLGAKFAKVDRLLAERRVSNVLLISVSVDPANDRPEQLRNFAARYGVTQRWKLVTGEKRNVEQLLRSLGEYTPDKTAHTGRVLIGRGDGSWVRVDGLGSPEKIADLLAAAAAQPSPVRNGS